MKKCWVIFCVGLALVPLTVFAGGRQPAAGTGSAGKPEISATMLDRGWVPAAEGSYEDNRWVRWINENSPVRVKWVPVIRTQSVQQINALFASGSAPDLVIEYGKSFMDNLYDQGVIQPVGEHIERYSTAYKQYLKENEDLVPYLLAPDGKQYGMTSRRGILDLIVGNFWIRQDWLEKFGMKEPKTIDEMLTFMRRVRDEDPDGNGVKDTYGMSFILGYLGHIKTLFGAPYNDFLVENGHFRDWTATGGYRDYLAFMALLYKEGLIDPEYVTDNQNIRQTQLFVTGKAGIHLGYLNNWDRQWRELRQNAPGSRMVPMDTPASSYGKFDLQFQDPARYMICMNKDAKNPQAVMTFMDWMITDGWWTLTVGLEGRHYNLVNGVPKIIDAEINKLETSYLQEYTPVSRYSPEPGWFPILAGEDPESQAWAQIQKDYYAGHLDDKPLKYVPYLPNTETIRNFTAEISAQVSAAEINIITGKISVDEGIRQINSIKNAAGWEAINAEKDAWYQQNRHTFRF